MEKLTEINSVDTDYRAEVVASGLIEAGYDTDKVMLVRQKGDKRAVSKDVDRIDTFYSNYDMLEYLYIYTHRASIYKSLPENLFHRPFTSNRQKTKEDVIHEIRTQREEEKYVRKFFQPFEMALDKILVQANAYERRYDKVHFYSDLTGVLNDYWEVLQYMSTGQALLFIKSIPLFSKVARDLDLMAEVISVVLDCPITIEEAGQSSLELESQDRVKLKDWKLDVNSVLGKSTIYENPDIVIHIGPVGVNEMTLFGHGKKNDLVLKGMVDLLVPFDRHVTFKYQTLRSEAGFRLSGKNHTAYLGINTTL